MTERRMITDPDVYFAQGCGRCDKFASDACQTRVHAAALAALRAVVQRSGAREEAKWGHPCYTHAGRNIAIIGAFKDGIRLSFFDAALLTDPDTALTRQGPNTRHPDALRFGSEQDVLDKAGTVHRYLAEAMGYAEAGLKPEKAPADIDLPDELTEALAADPELSAAFDALTPGRQRSHAITVARGKQSATRARQVEKLRERILQGKGATER